MLGFAIGELPCYIIMVLPPDQASGNPTPLHSHNASNSRQLHYETEIDNFTGALLLYPPPQTQPKPFAG